MTGADDSAHGVHGVLAIVPIVHDVHARPIIQIALSAPVVPTVQATISSVSVGTYSLLPSVENKERVEGKSYLISNNYHTNEIDLIIDSEAIDHMTYSEKDLIKISTPRKTVIINANEESYPVKGAEDVQCSPYLTLSNTCTIFINKVTVCWSSM
jgi:hypothetical protein